MTNPTSTTPGLVIRQVRKGGVPVAVQRRRLEQLRGISCDHLVRVAQVEEGDDSFQVHFHEVDGPLLTVVRAGRSGLSLGEAWRLLADLCAALVELHSRGILHGDLSPTNVIIRSRAPAGRAVVIDVGGEEEWELGTPGFQAPELLEGGHGGAGSDVWAAARLALWSVADEHRMRLAEELRPILQAPAEQRPTAGELQRQAVTRATPSVMLPDDARLAAAHLRAQVASARTVTAPRRARGPRRGRVVAALTALAISLGTYAVVDLWPRTAAEIDAAAGEEAEPPWAVTAILELTRIRDEALGGLDEVMLGGVTRPGSPAAMADQELLQSFRGSRPEGLRTDVEIHRVLDGGVVEAFIGQSPFVWRGGVRDGVRVGGMPPRCVQFHLVEEGGGLVVQRVSACAADAISG